MVEGSDDDSADGGRADEGSILSPHELDITESEHVEQIDEGRFVVSPDARTNRGTGQPQGGQTGGGGSQQNHGESPARTSASRGRSDQRTQQPQSPNDLSEEEVRRWLRENYKRSNSKYAFDVTAQFEGKVSQRRLASNDLITVFESLMLWYAQQVDSSMPVEKVLGILLMESNVPVRYPPESVRNLVKSTDLGPEDTIADLIEAVQDDDGVQL